MPDKQAKKQIARVVDYKATFGSAAGRRVLHDLMKRHHMMANTFHGDRDQMLLHEGERNAVLGILMRLKIDVAQLTKRLDEAHDQE